MTLQINGEARPFDDAPTPFTLAALMDRLAMKADRVAVELNLDIVPRDRWSTTNLHEGDKLEIVHFVGGGLEVSSSAQLEAAIETLYRVFSKYPLHPDTGACSCCHSSQDERVLHTKQLRRRSLNDLSTYAMDAIYTWGTGDDFKHFLPRLFELLAQFPQRSARLCIPRVCSRS